MTPEQKMEQAFGVAVGTRVVQKSPINRYPFFLFNEEDIYGTVELMNDTGDLMVRLDAHFVELDEWDNCLTYPNDGLQDGFLGAFSDEFKPMTLTDMANQIVREWNMGDAKECIAIYNKIFGTEIDWKTIEVEDGATMELKDPYAR